MIMCSMKKESRKRVYKLNRRSSFPTPTQHSETVDLDRSSRDALFSEECLDLLTLITLELDDLASLLIIDEGTVAGKFL